MAAPIMASALFRLDHSAIALSFDDGPDPHDTPRLIDLLAQHDIKATFFLIGSKARRHPDLVRALRGAGHSVGQHTNTHPDPWRISHDALVAQLDEANATLMEIMGEPVQWVRPPYGRLTPGFSRWAASHGQRVALWDVMPGDFLPSQSVRGLHWFLTRFVRPGSLVVLHEGGRASRITPDALARWLPEAVAAGYRFEAL